MWSGISSRDSHLTLKKTQCPGEIPAAWQAIQPLPSVNSPLQRIFLIRHRPHLSNTISTSEFVRGWDLRMNKRNKPQLKLGVSQPSGFAMEPVTFLMFKSRIGRFGVLNGLGMGLLELGFFS